MRLAVDSTFLIYLLICAYIEVVWTVDKQSSLIDSIMQNIHIPPLIFCTWRSLLHFSALSHNQSAAMENNSDIMTCMDGKQRITSIKR